MTLSHLLGVYIPHFQTHPCFLAYLTHIPIPHSGASISPIFSNPEGKNKWIQSLDRLRPWTRPSDFRVWTAQWRRALGLDGSCDFSGQHYVKGIIQMAHLYVLIYIYIYMFYFLNMMIFHGCHRYMLACWRYYYISSFLKLGGWYRFENNLSLSLFGDAHWFISQGLVFTLALWVQQGPPEKAHSCKQFQFLAKPSSLGATKGTLAHWEMSSFCRMVPHLWLRWSPLYKDNGLR